MVHLVGQGLGAGGGVEATGQAPSQHRGDVRDVPLRGVMTWDNNKMRLSVLF